MNKVKLFKRFGMIVLACGVMVVLTMLFGSSSAAANASMSVGGNVRSVAQDVDSSVSENYDGYEEVFSYKSILRNEYDSKILSKQLTQSEISFDDYCRTYIDPELTLDEITADNVDMYRQSLNSQIQPYSNFEDEDYILKGINDPDSDSFDPSETPYSAFQRHEIKYADKDMYYGLLREGDIILETNCKNFWMGTALNNPGHTAYIYNVNKEGAHGKYIQTIEAVKGGVQFGFLDDERMVNFGVVILRPTRTNTTIVRKASEFHYKQLNKPYHLSLTQAKTDIDSAQWYCSELNNAAYYYAGVDFYAVNSSGGVMPYNILHSVKTEYVRYGKYLDIRISNVSVIEKGYVIEVFNNTGSTVTVQYNSKRCFTKDAQNWKLKNDVKEVSLSSGSMVRLNILNNWFADAVAVSYVSGGVRYITYGNDMRTGSYLMATFKTCKTEG